MEVAMTSVTVEAIIPRINADLVLYINWLRMSLPNGSVPNRWPLEGADG